MNMGNCELQIIDMIDEQLIPREKLIRLYDQSNMLGSILALSKQIESVFLDNQFNQLSIDKQKIDDVVVTGMGSSLIAFKILEAVFRDNFTIPIFINNTYTLPNWVNRNSLVIISSYSLASYLQIFIRTRLIKFTAEDIKLLMYNVQKFIDDTKFHKKSFKYAKQLLEKNVHIIAADFLTGNAELFSKQLQWNAKQESSFSLIPETMHHISESINHPRLQKKNRIFIFLESTLLSRKAKDMIFILKKYLTKQQLRWIEIPVTGETKLIQAVEMIITSSLISYSFII